MHVNRDAEHAGEGDEIGSDVALAHDAVVGTPVVHNGVGVAESTMTGEAWNEPGRRPSWVGALFEDAVCFFRERNGFAFGNLQDRTKTLHEVEAVDGRGHAAACGEACAPAAAGEILGDRGMPARGFEAGVHLGITDVPEWLHGRHAVQGLLAATIEGGGAGIDEVQEAVCGFRRDIGSRHAGDGIRAPVGAEIGENLRGVGEQPTEEHGGAVEGIVFGCDNVRSAAAVPVERGVQNRLEEVAIRHVVGPLALALEA